MRQRTIQRARYALAAANVALTAAVAVAAHRVFFTRAEAHLPPLPVRDLALSSKLMEQLSQYEIIARELDRAPPPLPPAPPPTIVPSADTVLHLAFAGQFSPRHEDRFCIVERIGAAEQIVLREGETRDGWTCSAIEREGRNYVVAVAGERGTLARLRVKREDESPR